MLSKSTFNVIKNHFTAQVTDIVAFKALSPTEQLDALSDIASDHYDTKNVTQQELAGFILLFALQFSPELAGTESHFALRKLLGIPDPVGSWAKPNPPKTFPALVSQWPAEYAAATTAANYIDFASLKNDPIGSAAAAVRFALEIGGLEDLGDPRALQAGDPTLDLLIEACLFNVSAVQPTWYEGGVLKDTVENGVSKHEIDIAEEANRQKERAEARQRAVEIKRNEVRKQAAERRAALSAGALQSKQVISAIDELQKLEFTALKEVMSSANIWIGNFVDVVTLVPVGTDDAAKGVLLADLQQTIVAKLAETKPDWFRALVDGTLVLRRGEPRVKTGYDRRTKAIVNGLARLVNKYGGESVGVQIARFVEDPAAFLATADLEDADEAAA